MDLNKLLKHTSRSLYLSARILPKTVRPAFGVAYLLCRYADTIADTSILPADRRLHWITRFPTLIEKQPQEEIDALVQEIRGGSDNPYEKILIENLPACLDAFNKLPDEQKPFVKDVATAVCDGMEIDLSFFPSGNAAPKPFEKATDLTHYCRLMGGCPGKFWSQLIASSSRVQIDEKTFLTLGTHIGDAEQIVNILRDLPKDLRIGRCYFPSDDLRPTGLRPSDLLVPQNSPRFEPVKQKWLNWGIKNLQDAYPFLRAIPKTNLWQRAAVAWPVLWAADTLVKISQTPDLLNPDKRVKISRATIYATMLLTPLVWVSNRFFNKWLNHKIRKISG